MSINNNSAVNETHYEYDLKRDNTTGFWRSVNFKVKTKVDTNNVLGTSDDPRHEEGKLSKESDATSTNGWISPMEYYAKHIHIEANDDRTPTNGFIQQVDNNQHSKFLYKNLYWWCEDLHNWCVYYVDCDKPYLNMFRLAVWNGIDDWVPITNMSVPSEYKFSPLQNGYFKMLENNGNVIGIHRGKDNRLGMNFTAGPLTVNQGLLLSKTNTYSINDANNFQAKRWSSVKHIKSEREFVNYMYTINTTANGNTKFVIRFRNAIKNGIKILTDQSGQDCPWCGTIDFNVVKKNADNVDDKRTQIEVKAVNNDPNNLEIVKFDAGTCKHYNGDNFSDNGKYDNLHYLTAYDNSIDSEVTSWNFEEKIPSKDTKTAEKYDACRVYPVNLYHHKYNHANFKEIVWEKIFALYLIDNNGTLFSTQAIRKIFSEENGYEGAWNSSLDDETSADYDDILIYDEIDGTQTKIYPIYVSILDLLMLFKSLDMDDLKDCGWGNGKENPGTIPKLTWLGDGSNTDPYTRLVWLKKNRLLLKKLFVHINVIDAANNGWNEHTGLIENKKQFDKWISASTNLLCPTSDPVKVYFSYKENNEDHAGVLLMHKFGWYGSDGVEWGSSHIWRDREWTTSWDHITDIGYSSEYISYGTMQESVQSTLRDWFGNNSVTNAIGRGLGVIIGYYGNEAIALSAMVYNSVKYEAKAIKDLGSLVWDIVSLDFGEVWGDAVDFWSDIGNVFLGIADWGISSLKNFGQGIVNLFSGGPHDEVDLSYNYSKYDAKLKWQSPSYIIDDNSVKTHFEIGENFKDDAKKIVETATGAFNTPNERMKNSLNLGALAVAFENSYTIEPAVGDLREGISIGNPAVWRTATGKIMLSTFLVWGGKEGLIGGPNIYKKDEETGEQWITQYGNTTAEAYINNLCKGWFGDGMDKTIDDHWLKEYINEDDEVASNSTLVTAQRLEQGKVLEQLNSNHASKLKLKIKTYRPNIITTTEQDNIDIAKKW